MFRLKLALLLCLLAAPLRAEDTRDFIRFGFEAGPWGGATWTIWSDDRIEYRAHGMQGDFDMPGWKWDSFKKESGVARFITEGGWLRARAVADAALQDPLLREKPNVPPEMSDTGYIDFYLTGDEDKPDISVEEASSFDSASKTKKYWARIDKLRADLMHAIEADQIVGQ